MAADALCGCMKCTIARVREDAVAAAAAVLGMPPGFRYGCELCGNKRCPHHSDHALTCTRSNESGQPGSLFTK